MTRPPTHTTPTRRGRSTAAATGRRGISTPRRAPAVRVRWNGNTDTPLPPDEPAGRNPPDGAMLDYYLARPAAGPVVVEIRDRSGALVRRFASDGRPQPPDTAVHIPPPWVPPPPPPSP